MTAASKQVRDQLKRRFGNQSAPARATSSLPVRADATTAAAREGLERPSRAAATSDKQHDWVLEDLFRVGARGRAHADARFRGNKSAQQALDDLARAARQMRWEEQ